VENACKYARPAASQDIELSIDGTDGTLRFTVRDYGPGIDAARRGRLFRAFCKSDQDAANTAQGVGLGLALCRRMARDLGGSLRLDDTIAGPGAAFTLTLKRLS
jgi:K+-sensing histidine kinase KdpD